jgi:hypothetical protein
MVTGVAISYGRSPKRFSSPWSAGIMGQLANHTLPSAKTDQTQEIISFLPKLASAAARPLGHLRPAASDSGVHATRCRHRATAPSLAV